MNKCISISPFWGIIILLNCCSAPEQKENDRTVNQSFIQVLGVAQDGGYPQIGCTKECCKAYAQGDEAKKHITSLAIVDENSGRYWLIEATPDIGPQLTMVQDVAKHDAFALPSGIFITHAHIGHYAGLMQLGREALGANNIPVWVMPRMDSFLRSNGPWSQLVKLHNISIKQLKSDSSISLTNSIQIKPIRVPHRDEYSETVGFIISGNTKKILFIPDIDKWEKWDRDIRSAIKDVDAALLDGTFFQNGELPNRDMSEVPHPFVEESLKWFDTLSSSEKSKIKFIHFNHTNPLLKKNSPEKENVISKGFGVAEEGMKIVF